MSSPKRTRPGKHGENRYPAIGREATLEYVSWASMKNRCLNPNSIDYPKYGGAGVTVCARWLDSYENFLADMGRRPGPEFTLDRVKNELGYSPENCRWATPVEQARNRRNSLFVEYGGKKISVAEAASIVGLKPNTLWTRLNKGWPPERALSEPRHSGRSFMTHRKS